ncbi:hypothetical protein CDAR_512761 [Caerostris darwini]|uniref:Uncharacterized protein n=1 Tax=Caerostris darwini TaxID=1538125 RepID=A0AAV4SB62_9ARAC|nr:hypothetical protein CDAR_512761 [Caerostris darwini]
MYNRSSLLTEVLHRGQVGRRGACHSLIDPIRRHHENSHHSSRSVSAGHIENSAPREINGRKFLNRLGARFFQLLQTVPGDNF